MDGVDFLREELRRVDAPRCAGAGLAFAASIALAACGGQPPFPGSAGSLDDLGSGVLEAFARNDLEALQRFRLTENEHNTVIWPELPAADAGYPLDLAWRNIQLRNQQAVPRAASALRRTIQRAGEPHFLAVACEGEPQSFDTFVVHTECSVRFRAGDAAYRIQLFKDVLARNGGYKVFRYYDEDVELAGPEGDQKGGP